MIELKDVSKSLGSKKVLDRIQLKIPQNGIYCLLGESGSGKTTCLRLMNGLIFPDSGSVFIQEEELVTSQAVSLRRNMGYAQQGSGLFPHMNVYENISLIAKKSGWKDSQIKSRTKELLAQVHLNYDEMINKFPSQLSGGQKQRVSLARSLFMSPQIMLMDEPFGALDPTTRSEVQDLFIDLQKAFNLTVVIVTHDLYEAFKMADRIIILNNGKIEEQGTQGQLLTAPTSQYIQNYLAPMSPRHRLELIKLYMVMNKNVHTAKELPRGWQTHHLESQATKQWGSYQELRHFLQSQHQEHIYFVDEKGRVTKVLAVSDNVDVTEIVPTLYVRDSFLAGMKKFLHSDLSKIIVVNQAQQMVGCLSNETIQNI